MIYYRCKSDKAAFYFAAEEYIMQEIRPDEPVCLLWQTDDTVMVGANQVVALEIDKDYVMSLGINIVRRSSGGGAIFTDPGTLLYTIILPYGDVDPKEIANKYFCAPVIRVLAELGVTATPEGRNDILIDGKKISGIAQYVKYGYICTHGSLLFNADLSKLLKVLTVDPEKITSKALRSAGSRVVNIANYTDTKDISSLINALIEQCQAETKEFSESELAAIYDIKCEKYEAYDWTYGHNPPYTFHNSRRFEGGKIDVFMNIKNGKVADCRITGDFLALRPVSEIETLIIGKQYDQESLRYAFSGISTSEYIGSVPKEEFIDMFAEK